MRFFRYLPNNTLAIHAQDDITNLLKMRKIDGKIISNFKRAEEHAWNLDASVQTCRTIGNHRLDKNPALR